KHVGQPYIPTPIATFRRLMSRLPRDLDRFTFIDLGCGRGRMLAAATTYGFRRIVGVEFSAELSGAAERNMVAGRRSTRRAIDVLCGDAAEFRIPDGDCVLYLFKPFGMPVLERVVRNINEWQGRSRSRLYLIYLNCEPEVVDFLAAHLASARLLETGS